MTMMELANYINAFGKNHADVFREGEITDVWLVDDRDEYDSPLGSIKFRMVRIGDNGEPEYVNTVFQPVRLGRPN